MYLKLLTKNLKNNLQILDFSRDLKNLIEQPNNSIVKEPNQFHSNLIDLNSFCISNFSLSLNLLSSSLKLLKSKYQQVESKIVNN